VAIAGLFAAGAVIAQGTPDFTTDPAPFIITFAVGFGIGVFGHLAGSRLLVILGIALVFVATLVLPLALSFSN
jgi:hypothetical protein